MQVTPASQQLNLPWKGKGWGNICKKITDPIRSIPDMDIIITSKMPPGKLKPRQITQVLEQYFADKSSVVDRETFLTKILPMLQDLIKRGPAIFKNTPCTIIGHRDHRNYMYTREQCACLIACIWFGLFAKRSMTAGAATAENMQIMSFHCIFSHQNMIALQFLMCYFSRLCNLIGTPEFVTARVIIHRHGATPFDWTTVNAPISDVRYESTPVDSSAAPIKTISCCPIIGGNPGEMFLGTPTQEHVALLVYPDALIVPLLVSSLEDETVALYGAERISNYTGYGCGMTFSGECADETPAGSDGKIAMRQNALIFMDASSKLAQKSQFITDFTRDLDKAYCGYSGIVRVANTVVAAGNWTHGHSGNNPQIKFIQQLMAASALHYPVFYHGISRDFEDQITVLMNKLEGHTVAELFTAYLQFVRSSEFKRNSNVDLFDYINFDF